MRSSVTAERDVSAACLKVCVVLADEDVANARLDEVDRAVVRDCEGADRTAADRLLALELIFRRMREQQL